MFTNNTCDIEKDIDANRHTLSVLLGREKARWAYHAVLYTWIIAIVVLVAFYFTKGVIALPFMILSAYPMLKALLANPLAPQSRQAAMSQVCGVNIALGAWYTAAIFASNAAIML